MASGVAYAVLGLVAWVGLFFGFPGFFRFVYYAPEPLFLLGVMAALAALHLLHRERYAEFYASLSPRPWAGRLLGTLAFLLAFVGVALILAAELSAFGGPLAPYYWPLLLYGSLAASVGIVGYGMQTMGTGVVARWGGASILAGSPVSGFVLYLFGDLEWLLGVPWALVGYAILRTTRRPSEQPSGVRQSGCL